MSTHVHLPEDVWKLVLQHVPLKQRLSSCALVCPMFRAAAVAATDSIEATLCGQPAVDNFATYLQQHRNHLTSLVLIGQGSDLSDRPELQQLPCQHLQELYLISLNLGWGADEDHLSILDKATAITRLELETADCFPAAMAVLPNLQHLCIDGWDGGCLSDEKGSFETAFAFSSLQQLTHLGLTRVNICSDNLAYISSMTHLHTLNLSHCCMLWSDTPGLSLPPSLQHLELGGDCFQPSVLGAAAQLTHLDLADAYIENEGGVVGGSWLLEFLSKQQALDHLCLSRSSTYWPPPSAVFQALVASSSTLRVLDIDDCYLQDGVFAHIFPPAPSPALVLPRLEDLVVSQLPPGAVAGLVRSCPALQRATLRVEPLGAHLAALSQLSALTSLQLPLEPQADGNDNARIAESIQSVAGLTRLQELHLWLHACCVLRWQVVLPLTALRQLTSFTAGCF